MARVKQNIYRDIYNEIFQAVYRTKYSPKQHGARNILTRIKYLVEAEMKYDAVMSALKTIREYTAAEDNEW